MGLRNGYCFVGRSQAVIGWFEKGSAPVRKRRGEAAPVGLRELGIRIGGWYPMPGREHTGSGRCGDRQEREVKGSRGWSATSKPSTRPSRLSISRPMRSWEKRRRRMSRRGPRATAPLRQARRISRASRGRPRAGEVQRRTVPEEREPGHKRPIITSPIDCSHRAYSPDNVRRPLVVAAFPRPSGSSGRGC